MDKNDIINSILDVIKSKRLIKRKVEINENTSLFSECGIDSVDVIELIVYIEDKFNFEFEDTDLILDDLDTVSNIANIIFNRLEHK